MNIINLAERLQIELDQTSSCMEDDERRYAFRHLGEARRLTSALLRVLRDAGALTEDIRNPP